MAKKNFTHSLGHLVAYTTVEISVLPELQAFIPELLDYEKEQLETNILQEGLREPLLIWGRVNESEDTEFILVDGHNRYEICQRHRLPYKTKTLEFNDIEEVKNWMIDNQLGRRNLNTEQASYLRGLRYQREKHAQGGDRKSSGQFGNMNEGKRTSEKLADEYNVSQRTILRDAQYAEALDKIGKSNPNLKKQILAGELKVKKADVQKLARLDTNIPIENSEQIPQIIAQAEREAERETKSVKRHVRRTKKQRRQENQERIPALKQEIRELAKCLESRADVLGLEKRIQELKRLWYD